MAKLMLVGKVAVVELTSDPEDGGTIAVCDLHDGFLGSPHSCGWAERYDTLGDASQYAADHADTGRTTGKGR